MRLVVSIAVLAAALPGVALAQDKLVTQEQLSQLGLFQMPSGGSGGGSQQEQADTANRLESLMQSPQLAGGSAPANPPTVTPPPSQKNWEDALTREAMVNVLPGISGLQAAAGSTLPAEDMAALQALHALFLNAANPQGQVDPAALSAVLQQAGMSAADAAAFSNLDGLDPAAKALARSAMLQKVLTLALSKAGIGAEPTGQQSTSALMEAAKGAIEEKANPPAPPSPPPLPSVQASPSPQPTQSPQDALLDLMKLGVDDNREKIAELLNDIEQQKGEEATTELAKVAYKTPEKEDPPAVVPPPQPEEPVDPPDPDPEEPDDPPDGGGIWPAWMGENPDYASIYASDAPDSFDGFQAYYEGEARGSDGAGNDVVGGFYAYFAAEDAGDVFMEGNLLGIGFVTTLRGPTENQFDVRLHGGELDLTEGSEEYYDGGSLEGRFYGDGHEAVGGTFGLDGYGTPDLDGFFVGVAP